MFRALARLWFGVWSKEFGIFELTAIPLPSQGSYFKAFGPTDPITYKAFGLS